MYKKLTLRLLALIAVMLAVYTAFVVIVDPWFHYHGPLKAIRSQYRVELEDCYEVDAGLIRSWEYDSILIGSSLANNVMLADMNEKFGGQFIKLADMHVFASDVAMLRYAMQRQEVKRVVFELDPFTLDADLLSWKDALPHYLYDDVLFNDYGYVFSIDVASKALKTLTRKPEQRDPFQWLFNDGGSREKALAAYGGGPRGPIDTPQSSYDMIRSKVTANLQLVRKLMEDYPDVQYYFYTPPYGVLWWRAEAAGGILESDLACIRQAAEELLAYPNTEFACFLDMEEILDLDLYCDTEHAIPAVYTTMVQHMDDPAWCITDAAQLEPHFDALRSMVYDFDFTHWE